MAGEATEADKVAAAEAASDAEFNAGFTQEMPTATPAFDEPTPTPEPVEPPPEPPKLAQITEEQFQDLLKKATAIDEIKAESKQRDDKVFGHIGQLRQTLDGLKSQGHGKPVELTDEDFAELRAEYPDLADPTVKGLSKVLQRINAGQAPDLSKLEQQFATQSAQTRTEVIDAHLDAIVDGDWQEEVKTDTFKTWADKQPDDVKALADSNAMRDAAKLLRLYQKSKSAPVVAAETPKPTPAPTPAPVNTRARVLQANVNPRGSTAITPNPSADDEFHAAFNGKTK